MKANPHQPSAAALPERMIATVPSQAVPAGNPASSERVALRTVAGAACLMLIAHLWVALTRSINWDEFHYFDLIRRYAAGTLDAPLQTFHVHLFSWLLELPFEPTAQVRGGRLVMLACLGGAARWPAAHSPRAMLLLQVRWLALLRLSRSSPASMPRPLQPLPCCGGTRMDNGR